MKAIIDNIKILEQNAINKGLDELILMENAGLNLANFRCHFYSYFCWSDNFCFNRCFNDLFA